MATPNVLIGILAKLYLNTANYASPTWAEVTLVGDLQVPAKWDMVEVMIRASRVKFRSKTNLDVGITGKLLASVSDTSYTTILNALTTDDVLDFMALTGASNANGCRGFRFESQVFDGTQDQSPPNAIFSDLALYPALTANTPKSVLVTSGAPVFTAI